jgi:hypothetical protein
MTPETEAITQMAPDLIIQSGFAGFCAILLIILFWLIRQLISLQRDTNTIIAEGSETNKKVLENITQQTRITQALHDKLISRPCISKHEQN